MGRGTFPKGSDTQQLGVHFPTDLCRCGDSGPLHNIQGSLPRAAALPSVAELGPMG